MGSFSSERTPLSGTTRVGRRSVVFEGAFHLDRNSDSNRKLQVRHLFRVFFQFVSEMETRSIRDHHTGFPREDAVSEQASTGLGQIRGIMDFRSGKDHLVLTFILWFYHIKIP